MVGGIVLGSVDRAIGDRVHAVMRRQGVTQCQLAAALGIGQSTVSAKLSGRVSWSVRDLIAAAAALGVEPRAFLPGDSPVPAGRAPTGTAA